jgi:hypothetical protein
MHPPGTRPTAIWPFLALCLLAAMCINLGHFHVHHDGDSLVPVLTSLQRWTVFFWEQDRLGSLLPLVALPFRHPLANLLVQTGGAIFAGLASFFLLARFTLRDATWPVVGALGAAAFLLLTPAATCFYHLCGSQPYLLSLALGLGGLILAEGGLDRPRAPWRLGAALALLLLGHWVNFSASAALGPLVLLRALLLGGAPLAGEPGGRGPAGDVLRRAARAEWAWQLLLLAVSTALVRALMAWAPFAGTTELGFLPPGDWLDSWGTLAQRASEAFLRPELASVWWAWALVACPGALLGWLPRHLRAALVLGGVGLFYCLFTGTLQWVALNGLGSRYLMPGVLFLGTALVVLVVGPACAAAGRRARVGLCASTAPALLVTALALYGTPSLSGARADLDRSLGALTEDLLAARCTHVVGNFWDVWPAVYHANLVLHERGDTRMVWGIAYRCMPTREGWSQVPPEAMRLAIPVQSRFATIDLTPAEAADRYLPDVMPVEVERRGTIRVLRPAEAVARQEAAWYLDFAPDKQDFPCALLADGRVTAQELELLAAAGKEFNLGYARGVLVGSGWDPPGSREATWTVGPEARIKLHVPRAGGDEVLTVTSSAFVLDRGGKLDVDVVVNDELVAHWVFPRCWDYATSRGRLVQRSARVPATVLNRRSPAEVVFRMPGVKSPRELGLSDDNRQLGLYVKKITFAEGAGARLTAGQK